MADGTPGYIVVEGPVGAGKSALAERLAAAFGREPLLERATQNPFLSKFHPGQDTAALASQLYFLLEHIGQVRALRQTDLFEAGRIADFLVDTDRLFAEAVLSADELNLYHQVHDSLAIELPTPDLVIYLQASVEALSRRVRAYGKGYEKRTGADYLKKISDLYVDFFYHYDAAPLLIINTTELDFSADYGDFAALLDYLKDLSPGRRYFNPGEP